MTTLAGTRKAGGAGGWRPPWLGRLSWVAWHQHRASLIGLTLFAALIATVELASGIRVHTLWDSAVRDGCVNPASWAGPCRPLLSPFDVGWPLTYGYDLGQLLALLPIAIGMFLGGPLLAREYASHTTRFAWTQGAGRTRLTVTKVVLLGLAVLVVAALMGWLGQWSMQPIIALSSGEFDRWQPGLFVTTPVTEAAAATLAYAFGLLAGVVTRRVVPAIAATAVATLALALLTYGRLHYWLLSLGLRQGADPAMGANPNAGYSGNLFDLHKLSGGRWLDQGWYAGPGGHRLNSSQFQKLMNSPGLMTYRHDTFQVTFQPAGRYWLFQFSQGGAEVLIALLLGALAIWLVRRRKA